MRGSVLHVHAFAEEMNKSRRVVALQSRALARRGFSVLLVDLYGCGDSDGDFGQADWSLWRDDVMSVAQWWRTESGHVPVLWGLRAGCLLLCDAARDTESDHFLFWQPQVSGTRVLQQFLRLRAAQAAFASVANPRVTTQSLREMLARGDTVEVAGYSLAPALALGLDASKLSLPPQAVRAAWMEIVPEDDSGGRALARAQVDAWREDGIDASLHAVRGPAFWETQEIAECEALIQATVERVETW